MADELMEALDALQECVDQSGYHDIYDPHLATLRRHLEPQWTSEVPTHNGLWWHCWGEDDRPFPLWISGKGSPPDHRPFIQQGQGGFTQWMDCEKYGGYWMPAQIPAFALPAPANQEGRT